MQLDGLNQPLCASKPARGMVSFFLFLLLLQISAAGGYALLFRVENRASAKKNVAYKIPPQDATNGFILLIKRVSCLYLKKTKTPYNFTLFSLLLIQPMLFILQLLGRPPEQTCTLSRWFWHAPPLLFITGILVFVLVKNG